MNGRDTHRLKLVLIAALFALPIVLSLLLNLAGWRPEGQRNYGELLQPAQDLRGLALVTDDGTPVALANPEGWFHVLLALPQPCDARCAEIADGVRRVWTALARRAPRVRFLLAGTPDDATRRTLAGFDAARFVSATTLPEAATGAPDPEGKAFLPATWIVDPHGYLVLRYAPGYDPMAMRGDLSRLIR